MRTPRRSARAVKKLATEWLRSIGFDVRKATRLLAQQVLRAGTLSGTGTPGLCDGSFAQDLNALWCPTCPKPAKNPGAGATVQAQLWYRDPLSTSNQTTSLSDAIEVVVGL